MAKFNYASLRATAVTLIDRFGRTFAKNSVTNTGVSWNPTQTISPSNITGVFLDFKRDEIDNTLVLATDKKFLTYDEVVLTDIILDDSIEYKVMYIETINPGDTRLIYKVQLRR